MHPFAALGPIDPTVTNEFNPIEAGSNRKLGISVEDVKAYVSFIKETVGIKHEEELVRTVEILANKVHPLALGNVERFLSQSRLVAGKLLGLHTDENSQHKVENIIEALASKFYFHGHPINRKEARQLGLKIPATVPPEVEETMWDLFTDYEEELQFREKFDPVSELFTLPYTAQPTPGLFVEVARLEKDMTWAMVESATLSSRSSCTMRYTLVKEPQQQSLVDIKLLDQKWHQTKSAANQPTAQPTTTA